MMQKLNFVHTKPLLGGLSYDRNENTQIRLTQQLDTSVSVSIYRITENDQR